MIYAWYAEQGPALLADEKLDAMGAESSVVRRSPVGVLLGIMPWNFPHYQVARFVAPNLMVGNTILLKHAPICAGSALLIEEVLHTAGVPEDAYVNVFADNDQVADIIADPRVHGVSLTGSERAGAAVAEIAGRNLKKVVLELGGSDAFIVLGTDDLDSVVKAATRSRTANNGQACNAAKRMIVLDSVYEEFVDKLTASFQKLSPGDPLADGTRLGPMSSQEAADGLLEQVADAVQAGATVARGWLRGRRAGRVRAADRADRRHAGDARLVRGALRAGGRRLQGGQRRRGGRAGQLLVVRPERSVWSADADLARETADKLEVGMAFVNEHGTSLPGLPFGGVKRSGFGRELGPWGMDEFVNKKLVRVSRQ